MVSKLKQQDTFHGDVAATVASDRPFDARVVEHRDGLAGALAIAAGILFSGVFYAVVLVSSWAPLQRYFLGHPVAIAATVLFFVAIAILCKKFIETQGQWQQLRRATDQALSPQRQVASPEGEFRDRHDAGFVARAWSSDLSKLPRSLGRSHIVVRLKEVLMRQSGRGTSKHLADDLRELSARDADSAHDSFALVRIIVWAIPMLGFLGTVIGITQTLGGLDFSDGNAAVDNLKSGLYVAFDTTALGLVLSIVAIFLQFPVERSEQQLLSAIDERVGYLTGLHLPGDEAADNQFKLIANLCDGVRAAVAESLSNQTSLWRQTIDEAREYWQSAQETQAEGIVNAVEHTLTPALRDHATELQRVTDRQGEQIDSSFDRWRSQLDLWQQTIVAGAEAMTERQATLLDQVDQASHVREQASSVIFLQQALAANLSKLEETNQRIDENMGAAAGQGMADAMIVLARAVDVLTKELGALKGKTNKDQARRAA